MEGRRREREREREREKGERRKKKERKKTWAEILNIEFSSLVGWWTQFTLSFQVHKEKKVRFVSFPSGALFQSACEEESILLMLFLVGPLMEQSTGESKAKKKQMTCHHNNHKHASHHHLKGREANGTVSKCHCIIYFFLSFSQSGRAILFLPSKFPSLV